MINEQSVTGTSQTDSAGPLARRLALAGVLRVVRGHKGWSVETASGLAGSNHVSWRRMEAGSPTRPATYSKVENLLHLPLGSVQRALGDDEAMVDLARELGVDTTEVAEGVSPTRWVVRFAIAFGPNPKMGVPTVVVEEPEQESIVVSVADIVARLAAEKDRSPAKEDALQALLRVMPELGTTCRAS